MSNRPADKEGKQQCRGSRGILCLDISCECFAWSRIAVMNSIDITTRLSVSDLRSWALIDAKNMSSEFINEYE